MKMVFSSDVGFRSSVGCVILLKEAFQAHSSISVGYQKLYIRVRFTPYDLLNSTLTPTLFL